MRLFRVWAFALLLVFSLMLASSVVLAQDVPPATSVTASWFDEAGAFVGRLLFLAGVLQTAINALKPVIIEPTKTNLLKLDERGYLIFMYILRGAVTTLAYFGLWGGIEASRLTAPRLFMFVPDWGVAFAAISLIVLGQEALHAIMDWLYAVKDGVGQLELPPA